MAAKAPLKENGVCIWLGLQPSCTVYIQSSTKTLLENSSITARRHTVASRAQFVPGRMPLMNGLSKTGTT